jgi:hypothetical protein
VNILKEARKAEIQLTEEANKRLREATLDAQQRELTSHNRIKEAQEYFKTKEQEADQIIQKARRESQELTNNTERDLQEIYTERKSKMQKFLLMKQESGLSHIKLMTEQHFCRLTKMEQKAHEKIEDLKRKELKKVAKIREEQLSEHGYMRENALLELKAYKEKSLKEINELRKQQEAELADKKKSMLEHINQSKFRTQKSWEDELKREKEQFERSKKERINNATQAVINVFIAEIGSLPEKEQMLREKVKANLEMAINGQTASAMKEMDQVLDMNPLKRKEVLPVAATIVLADIGSFRTNSAEFVKDLIKQQQSASEIYANQQKTEWKEKHTYNPEQTVGHKATYVDNIIYTVDYEKVMENEEFQNDWILKVHDFMVKDLELSEDVAINFISSEGTLVKELSLARKDLHPQFLDTGLKKMRDLERTHLGWLKEKLPEEAKMQKFSEFQKTYFDNFYQEKIVNSREMASEVKIEEN